MTSDEDVPNPQGLGAVFYGYIPADNNQSVNFDNGFARSCHIEYVDGDGGRIVLSVNLIEQTDLQYKYHVSINQDENGFGGSCSGDVVINYANQVIHNIIVNGQPNGRLHDRYNDGFDLSLQNYIHFITQLPYNF